MMRHPIRLVLPAYQAAMAGLVCLGMSSNPLRAEPPWKPNLALGMLQIQAPWDGPGAAIYNPALLSETNRMYATYTRMNGGPTHVVGIPAKEQQRFWQVAASVRGGFKVGFAWYDQDSPIDGSNAVSLEHLAVPMVAWAMDSMDGSRYHFGFGAAVPIREMNAFNAIKSTNSSLDLGVNILFPVLGRKLGRFHLAVAAQNLYGGGVKLPEDNPTLINNEYDALRPAFAATALWSGLGGKVDLYLDQKLLTGTGGDDEGPTWGNLPGGRADLDYAYGAEFRPIRWFGLKFKRTWLGYYTVGALGYIPVGQVFNLGLSIDLAHDKFSSKDEGRGKLIALGINVFY